MSGPLHAKHKMEMAWAAEVHDPCRAMEIPFRLKQSSDIYTELGINGLSLHHAGKAGHEADPSTVPLIREYPETALALLPFVEHGQRFIRAEYRLYEEGYKAKAVAATAGARPSTPVLA